MSFLPRKFPAIQYIILVGKMLLLLVFFSFIAVGEIPEGTYTIGVF